MTQWAKMLALSTLAFLLPLKPLMVGVFTVTALDTITGVLAAKKRGEKITSAGLRRTVTKSLIYSVTLVAAFVAEKNLLGDMVPAAKLVAGAIGIAELKSVLENASSALGENLFSVLMAKLGSLNDPRRQLPEPDPEPQPPASAGGAS